MAVNTVSDNESISLPIHKFLPTVQEGAQSIIVDNSISKVR